MECLNNADGLLNLQTMVDQMTAIGLLEDKSIPIVLGKGIALLNCCTSLTVEPSSRVFWMGHSLIWRRQLLGWNRVFAKSTHG
jgi:hypothetical protein